jgi:hypothetical protein
MIMRSILVSVLLIAIAGTWPARAEEADASTKLTLSLQFSTDEGLTWSRQPPVLDKPGILKVRVTWEHARPEGEKEPYVTTLWSSQADFASANNGRQTWGGKPAWYQRPEKYYVSAGEAHQFDYDLNLGKRPDGTMGFRNVWDKDKNQFVDGPLRACRAAEAGERMFSVRVNYMQRNVSPHRRVEGVADFTVRIGAKPTTQPTL